MLGTRNAPFLDNISKNNGGYMTSPLFGVPFAEHKTLCKSVDWAISCFLSNISRFRICWVVRRTAIRPPWTPNVTPPRSQHHRNISIICEILLQIYVMCHPISLVWDFKYLNYTFLLKSVLNYIIGMIILIMNREKFKP